MKKRVVSYLFVLLTIVCLTVPSILMAETPAGEITVFAHTAPQTAFFQSRVDEFQKKTGIKVTIYEVPFAELKNKMMTELVSGTGKYDVLNMTNSMMYGASEYLDSLKELYTPDVVTDLPKVAIDSCKDIRGEIKGFPYMNSTLALYYRTDLFKKYGLKPPQTWSDFLTDAQKLTIGKGPMKIWGTVIDANEKAVQGPMKLLGWFYQAGGKFADANGKPMIYSKQNVKALTYVCDLVNKYKVAPPEAPAMTFEDVHNMFIQGRAAMAINWQYMVSMANSSDQSVVKGKFAVVPLPKGIARGVNVDNWMFCVPKASKNKKAALEWIKYISSTENQIGLLKSEGLVARLSAMDPKNPKVLEANPYIEAFSNSLREFGVPQPKWTQLDDSFLRLGYAMNAAITKSKTPDQALRGAQKEIEDLISKK
jgi:multiple sugar transport system substrate-binding protein